MNRKKQSIVILILGALSTISPFAIDMYLPGFPAIAKDLNTSIANVQLSLTSYFIGIAAGQLLYGPLLDRFGRRKPLYVGLFVYFLASIACAFADSVNSLIALRFLQALGGCAGMVAAQTLVRDLFKADKLAQAFSSITLVIAVSPMIAPTVGGIFTSLFGWHSVFVTLAAITMVIMIMVYFYLPSGRGADESISLKPKAVVSNFITVIKQPQFLIYTLAGGFASAAPFAYIAGSAYVFMDLYGVSEQQYGWIFATIGGIIIGSSQLNHLLLKRFNNEKIVKAVLTYQLVMGSLLLLGTFADWFNAAGMIVMLALFLAGHGLTNPNATALSLAPFVKHTGSAASLSGAFRMAMGGVTSGLVSILHNGTQMPMVLIMTLCVVIGFSILLTGKWILKAQGKEISQENTVVI